MMQFIDMGATLVICFQQVGDDEPGHKAASQRVTHEARDEHLTFGPP